MKLKKIGLVLSLVGFQVLVPYLLFRPESAKADPIVTEQQIAAKNAAVTQCYMEQKVPLMGFGFKVVCVKKEAVQWIK